MHGRKDHEAVLRKPALSFGVVKPETTSSFLAAQYSWCRREKTSSRTQALTGRIIIYPSRLCLCLFLPTPLTPWPKRKLWRLKFNLPIYLWTRPASKHGTPRPSHILHVFSLYLRKFECSLRCFLVPRPDTFSSPFMVRTRYAATILSYIFDSRSWSIFALLILWFI